MEKENLLERNKYLTKQRNIIFYLLIAMTIANLLLVIKITFSSSTLKLLPSEISGAYEFKGNKVNDIYLKDNALEVIKTILNITANNLDQMQEAVLKATHPAHHFSVKAEISKKAKEIKSRNTTNLFIPLSVKTDTQNLTADIYGEYYTLFGGISKKEEKTYRLKFSYNGVRLLLMEITELKEEKK